jgi:hypothetical protein
MMPASSWATMLLLRCHLLQVLTAEGHTNGRVNATARSTRRGRRPWHVRMVLCGNRAISHLAHGPLPPGPPGQRGTTLR